MELRILGPIEVRHDGLAVELRGTKPRALLALLAIRANQAVSTDQLIEELWEGTPPPSAATALRVHVKRLREVLEPDRDANAPSIRLPAVSHGYLLRVEPDELDADRFERLVLIAREATERGDPRGAVRHLNDALELWRGDVLVDVRDLAAAAGEIARLEELRAVAIEQLAAARLELGDHALVIDLLSRAIEEYPLREELTAHLMVALYRAGRQADALRAYAVLARRLDEIGVTPSARVRELESAVLLQDPHLDHPRGRPPVPARRRAGRVTVGHFVGRREPLGQLFRAFEASREGPPRLALVHGPAGIGKTALVDEFADRLEESGVVVHLGRCEAQPGDDYDPVVQILRPAVEVLDAAARAAMPPELERLVATGAPAGARAGSADVEIARYRLFEAVATVVAQALPPPRVLVVEDVHWADRPTLALLRHLLRHDALVGTLVVATCRDDDIAAQQAETLARLAPRLHTDDIELIGLDEHETRALIRTVAAPDVLALLANESAVLGSLTGGNPLFLQELLRELEELPAAAEPLDDVLARIAPAGVRALVTRRTQRLGEAGHRIVCAAAVLGRECSVELLAAVAGVEPEIALEGVEEALAARLLVEDRRALDRFAFSHALVANAVHAVIDEPTRTEMHRRAAETLDRDPRVPAAEIAHHLWSALPEGDVRIAATAFERAGHEATDHFAFAEAARWYERALEQHVAIGTPEHDLGALRYALARAYQYDHRAEDARASYLQAAESARAAGDATLLVRVALAADGPWTSGSDFQAVALAIFEEALPHIRHDDPLRVEIYNGMASDLYYTDPAREERLAREAVVLADELDDRAARATALLALHRWYTHDPRVREARLDLALRARDLLADHRAHGELLLRVERALLCDRLEHADRAAFDADLDAYEQRAAAVGSPRDIYWATAVRATQATMDGDLDIAEQYARGAALRGRELEQNAEGAYVLQRFVIRTMQDRLREELPVLEAVGRVPTVFRAGAALSALGLSDAGNVRRAAEVVWTTLGPDGEALPRDVFWLAALALSTEPAIAARDHDLVALVRRLLLPCGDHVVVFGTAAAVLGSTHHWLGLLAAACDEDGRAQEHFDEAARVAARLGTPYWELAARIEDARLRLRRGPARDRLTSHGVV